MTRNSDSGLSRHKFLIASGTVGLAGLAGCTENNTNDGGSGGDFGGEDSPDDGSNELPGITGIAGSPAVSPLATAVTERSWTEHSEVSINLQSIGPGSGFANCLCTGQTGFNNALRLIKGEEQDQCESNGVTPVELKVVTDALTVIVNSDNDFLSKGFIVRQLQTILSVESTLTTWSDVNSEWSGEEIEIHGPTSASSTYDYFIEAIVRGEDPGHRQDYSATEQDRTITQGVEDSEYAIGYLGFAHYSESINAVQAVPIKNDASEFVKPLLDTVLSGEYSPLSRPLFAYPVRESFAEEHIAELIRYWIENSISREIAADEVGYVPSGRDDQQEMLDTLNTATERAN